MILLAKIHFLLYLQTIIVVIVGLLSYKKLDKLKPIVLIPLFSLIQMTISGLLISSSENYSDGRPMINSTVEIYSCLEFVIISYFIKSLDAKIINKIVIKIAIIISVIMTIFNLIVPYQYNVFISDLRHIGEGLLIEILILSILMRQIKRGKISSLLTEPILIVLWGIFNAYLIMLPINVITNFYLKNIDDFYKIHAITNSIGYILMYCFFLYSFYAARNRGIN
jgi:hypothetical protein